METVRKPGTMARLMRQEYPPRRDGTQRGFSRRSVLRGTLATSALATASALAGCGLGHKARSPSGPGSTSSGQAAGGKPKPGGVYNDSLLSNPPSLDLQRALSQSGTGAIGAAMSRPLRFKLGPDASISDAHDLENELALRVQSPDAVTWTVKLRSDAYFQNIAPVNGHPVQAEDVKATFVRSLSLTDNPGRASLTMVDPEKIETPAPDTVVFHLKYPFAAFTQTLASTFTSWIFPREVLSGGYDPTKQVIGSGPFILDSYTPDVAVTLKKNPAYFEKGRPYVDGVRVAIIPTSAQALAQFTAGHLDLLQVYENDIEAAKRDNSKAAVITDSRGTAPLLFFQLGNASGSPFRDIRIRRAVSMALDRTTVAKALYQDRCQYGFSVSMNWGKWALNLGGLPPETARYHKFDLGEAKQLFGAAGGENLSVRLVYVTGYVGTGTTKPVAEAFFNMLQALPWKIELGTIDFNNDFVRGGKGYLYGNLPKDMILCSTTQPFTIVDEYLFNYYDSRSLRNQENLQDPQIDARIDKARTTLDEDARRKAYLDVQLHIADQMYSVGGTPVGNQYTLAQPRVQNFLYSPENGNFCETWAAVWLAS